MPVCQARARILSFNSSYFDVFSTLLLFSFNLLLRHPIIPLLNADFPLLLHIPGWPRGKNALLIRVAWFGRVFAWPDRGEPGSLVAYRKFQNLSNLYRTFPFMFIILFCIPWFSTWLCALACEMSLYSAKCNGYHLQSGRLKGETRKGLQTGIATVGRSALLCSTGQQFNLSD